MSNNEKHIEGEGSYEAAEMYNEAASEFAETNFDHREAAAAGNTEAGEVEGEGSYEGSEAYNQGAKEFAESGKVEEAAREAKNSLDDEDEADEMRSAEEKGKEPLRGMAIEDVQALDEAKQFSAGPLHVEFVRGSWMIRTENGRNPTNGFEHIEDALRRAHELAAMAHVPLHVHGPDGSLVDKYEL
ncbi:hypothetical protein [Haliangium ochraceum]|uniref:Uncharacterized protein n=1 Tax=Haliangium ochraceum (strain DSM 14365 / JCM 11303 / SMP-2) TaxID=502025 RepID=D0LZM1_HALO1|nr:hypothetical protein [Haliangium ochraceum]ACY18000.1 hypothetical protein Hoch_5517 [Haliangium ochraceum DSM 14365]